MIQLAIFGVIVAVLFFTRKIWARYLVLFFAKGKKPLAFSNTQAVGSVFSPTGTKRTFIVAIEIDELGDGTAKFAIVKLKEKDII